MTEQISPKLFDILTKVPMPIESCNDLILWNRLKDNILELGKKEHTGDWDPYVTLHMKNGQIFETHQGYPEIDLTDPEYPGFYFVFPTTEDEQNPPLQNIPIGDIAFITLNR